MSNSHHERINLFNLLVWFSNALSATTFSFPKFDIFQRKTSHLEVL